MTTLTSVPAVETPALIIREIMVRDWRAFTGFMTLNLYQQHISLRLKTEAEVKAFVTRAVARQGDGRRNVFHLCAHGKAEGLAVGDGFIVLTRPGVAEIGWGVAPMHWGKRFGTEIGRALLGLAVERLDAQRVWCKVMTANDASLKLARRIGMKHMRSHADYPMGAGRFKAVEIFALSAQDYFETIY